MNTLTLTSAEAEDLLGIVDGEVIGDFHCMRNVMIDHRRWAITHAVTFKYLKDNKYYMTSYQKGATEMQDIDPWFDEDKITCTEVEPVQKTITVFEVKK